MQIRLVQLESGGFAVQRRLGWFCDWDWCETSRPSRYKGYGEINYANTWHKKFPEYYILDTLEEGQMAFDKVVEAMKARKTKKDAPKIVKVIRKVTV